MATLEERRRRERRRAAQRASLRDASAVTPLPPAEQPQIPGALANDSIAIQAPHKQSTSQQENSPVQKITLGEKLRYRFDNVMARGTGAIIGLLGLVTFIFILVVAAILEIFQIFPLGEGAKQFPFGEAIWQNLLRTLDTGTMGADEGWGYRIASLIITVVGIVVAASLIGIISNAFDSKVEDLRKGGSKVLEKDHTLILGWSAKVFPIVSERSEEHTS